MHSLYVQLALLKLFVGMEAYCMKEKRFFGVLKEKKPGVFHSKFFCDFRSKDFRTTKAKNFKPNEQSPPIVMETTSLSVIK